MEGESCYPVSLMALGENEALYVGILCRSIFILCKEECSVKGYNGKVAWGNQSTLL